MSGIGLSALKRPAAAMAIGLVATQPVFASQSSELAKLRAENAALKAELTALKSQPQPPSPTPSADDPAKKAKASAERKRLFIRKDHFETVYYIAPGGMPEGKGATVSYTEDYLKNAGALTVQAFGSYVLIDKKSDFKVEAHPGQPTMPPLHLAEYTMAPFIYTNGTINAPAKATEKSTLQVGIDNEFELPGGPVFDSQVLRISPYFQTDFRGQGDIYGIGTAWEPIKLLLGGHELNLGITADSSPKLVSMYWRVIGEANVFHVADAGLSNWQPDTTYAQLGGRVALYGILFQNMKEAGPLLCGRIGFNTSFEYLRDPINGRGQHDYHAEVDYALGASKATFGNDLCDGPEGGGVGTSTLALTYDNGTDKDSNETREQMKLALTYQY
ncbi:hypothetical protein [Mesorhizobium qingshengii]|uniref:Uncharacterized protein n=1 Tax=Mesorhizobium qingshengii TaxID=1165689 RepID=A0A1G5XGC0_9HYPH|nr:hypothetical protein [Mesorhizobium qingshengii]SDA69498.1 hypothetical protein SAMN02927914_02223 [Mesorhizobium qingshengii]